MANDERRHWLEAKFEQLEQSLRANVAAVWTRLVTLVQALEEKIKRLQERMQLFEARLTAVERKTSWMPQRSDTGRLRHLDQDKARRAAYLVDEHFNENELRVLCLDFHIEYENVEGETKREKALELAMHFYRRNTLDVFINWLKGQRPNVEWPDTILGD